MINYFMYHSRSLLWIQIRDRRGKKCPVTSFSKENAFSNKIAIFWYFSQIKAPITWTKMSLGGGADITIKRREKKKKKVFHRSSKLDPQIWSTAASYLNLLAMWQKAESPLKWFGRLLSSVLLSILYGYPWPPETSTASGLTFKSG